MPTAEKLEQERTSLNLIKNAFSKQIITHEPVRPSSDESGMSIVSVYDFMGV